MNTPSTRTKKIAAAIVALVALLVLALLSPGWRHEADERARAVDTSNGDVQAAPDCIAVARDDAADGCEETAPDTIRTPHSVHAVPGRPAATPDDLVAQSIALGLGERTADETDPQGFSPLAYLGLLQSQPELIAMNLPGAGPYPGSGIGQSPCCYGLVPGPITLGHFGGTGGGGGGSGGIGGGAGLSGSGGGSFVPNERTGSETPGNEPNGGNDGGGGSDEGSDDNGGTPGGSTPPTGGSPTLPGGGPVTPFTLAQQTPLVETVPGPSALALAGVGAALVSLFRRRLGSRA